MFFPQIEEARARVSEKSSNMHNTVVESHDKSKMLEKELKSLSKELQALQKEKDAAERKKTESMKMLAKKELDVKDINERIETEARTKVRSWCVLVQPGHSSSAAVDHMACTKLHSTSVH